MPKRSTNKKPPEPKQAWFPRIKKLTPRGFLSFAPDFPGVELGDLNVFVGANGSGKSNFFEAARFLQEAQRNVRGFLGAGGSTVIDWPYRGHVGPAEVEVVTNTTWNHDTLRYRLSFEPLGSGVRFFEEDLWVETSARRKEHLLQRLAERATWAGGGPASRPWSEPVQEFNTALETTRSPTQQTRADLMRTLLSNWRFQTEAGFGRYSNPLKRNQTTSSAVSGRINEDGSNFALELHNSLNVRNFRAELIKQLSVVLPSVEDVVVPVNMNMATAAIVQTGGATILAPRLSDGTLRWLQLCLLLLNSDDKSPLFIEEPELGLHPDAIRSLADLLRSASTHRQIIVNTHSSLLVSAFTDQPECVYAFDRDEHGTRVDRVNPKLIKSWKDRGEPLGEIWAAGAIGGNRW